MQTEREKSNTSKSNIKASSLSSFLLKKRLYQFSQPQKYRTVALKTFKKIQKDSKDQSRFQNLRSWEKVCQTAMAACFFPFPLRFAPAEKLLNLYKSYSEYCTQAPRQKTCRFAIVLLG